MNRLLESPGFLLVIVGALLGANFPIGKLVSGAGVPGIVWAALLSITASLSLGVYVFASGRKVAFDRQHLRYFAITALTAYAIPNALIFAAIPHLGSGLTSVFYTLSPIFTLVFSGLAGLRKPRFLELAGIAFGFAGALMVVSGRGEIGKPAELIWLLAAFAVPLSLALGNVYRTLDWPDNANPVWLAVGSHAVAGAVLSILALILHSNIEMMRVATIPLAVVMQVIASSLMLPLFFQLQRVGGPVTLSQIGIVAAGVGIGIGSLVFGERYATIVWVGVAVIVVDVGLTVFSRLQNSRGT